MKEQLGCWQEYENALNSVSQLIHQSQSTLELVESDPPTSLRALDISERYLNVSYFLILHVYQIYIFITSHS